MAASTTRTDRTAIEELRAEYCYRFDSGDEPGILELFTEDAVLDPPGDDAACEGREQLRNFFADSAAGEYVHSVHNPVITIDGDRAEGNWYFDAQLTAGDTTERIQVKTDGSWRFSVVRIDVHLRIELR